MVGDGPERPHAEAAAEEQGLRERVLFLGKHASVHELLSCADLFLLPSENESFGLAALEAMACGAPVVASRVGGLPEVVEHGETGFLFEKGDVEAMAEASARILADEGLHARMKAAGRRLAVERFSAEAVVPRYERYYETVVAENLEAEGAARGAAPGATDGRDGGRA